MFPLAARFNLGLTPEPGEAGGTDAVLEVRVVLLFHDVEVKVGVNAEIFLALAALTAIETSFRALDLLSFFLRASWSDEAFGAITGLVRFLVACSTVCAKGVPVVVGKPRAEGR